MTTRAHRAERLTPEQRRQYARGARAEKARRSLAEFFRQAVAAGVVHGVAKLEWADHLDAICHETQMMLEGWLVANGYGTPEMVERQAAAWASTGAEWHDGQPDPWLRMPLVQNWIGGLPPGTLKSTVVMVLANAWMWLHAPSFKFGAASGNIDNVSRDSLATRDIVTSSWYRETFGITWTIRRDADAIGHWVTTAGGERLSRTIGAGFTGQHVHGVFVDDPDDADGVWNEPARRRVQGRWTRAIENRVVDERTCIRMLLQQGVHSDDMTRYLLRKSTWSPTKRMGWAWFCVPMEFGKAPKYAPKVTPFGWRDWRTTHGERLQPDRFTLEVLADKLEKLGSHGYQSQYNQDPTPLDAGMFPRPKMRFFVIEGTDVLMLRKRPDGCASREEAPPVVLGRRASGALDLDSITVTVDCANGGEGEDASATGIMIAGRKQELSFVLDDRTRVMGIDEMYEEIASAVCAMDGIGKVLIELKAAGASVIAEIKKRLKRGDLKGPDGRTVQVEVVAIKVPSTDGKVARARGMIPPYENGMIFFLDGAAWLYERIERGRVVDEGCVAEVTSFPASKRNDRIDALSQFITYFRNQKRPALHGGIRGTA